MALDRQSIQRTDFPQGRRGYEPEAVAAHLEAIADEVEELKGSTGTSSTSLASSAGEQVRTIIDAAETTAAQIRADADRDAKKVLADARSELRSARDQAAREASDQVSKIAQSSTSMLERIDAMEQEIGKLVQTLRGGADSLGDPALPSALRGTCTIVSSPVFATNIVLKLLSNCTPFARACRNINCAAW